MNTLQQYVDVPAHIVIPGNLPAFFTGDYFDAELVALFNSGRDPQESIDGLIWQFERKREELKRAEERFEAACHVRDREEIATRIDTRADASGKDEGESGAARTGASRSLLRAQASLAQLELNTVRNQVEYLAGLIHRIQQRVEVTRARLARGEELLRSFNS